MSAFFAMGGYGAYIWPAYGIGAILLVGLWLASVRALRAREAELGQAEPESRRRAAPR